MASVGFTVLDPGAAGAALNAVAAGSGEEWLLWCPPPLDAPAAVAALLDPPPAPRFAAVVLAAPQQIRGDSALVDALVGHMHRPSADPRVPVAIRARAWQRAGGVHEGMSAGALTDLLLRLDEPGRPVGLRASALGNWTAAPPLRDARRQGAGCAWLARRHPDRMLYPGPWRALLCASKAAARSPTRGPWELAGAALTVAGAATDNGGGDRPDERAEVVVLIDEFPELSETFVTAEVRQLQQAGIRVRVEAIVRAPHPNRAGADGLAVSYLEDDALVAKARALIAITLKHPVRTAADVLAALRWRREAPLLPLRAVAPVAEHMERSGERRAHVHFAAESSLLALRLRRLIGIRYSVTAHAHEIFRSPNRLREKLAAAEFVTTGCDYNVRHLRAVLDDDGAPPVHRIAMGVDPEVFRRRRPYPGGRSLLAVGRLVEKKGFGDLIDAVALLERSARIDRLSIVGDGALREELERRIEERGVGDLVHLVGSRSPAEVRDLLEEADALVMPCVVAADGDRDSMPVVVKEALAMAVPVIATREVGLPEVVRPEWGRLVPPRDPAALAAAIDELLLLPAERRRAMGEAGRRFVAEELSIAGETRKLVSLLRGGS